MFLIKEASTIIYVNDQAVSTRFYTRILNKEPRLNLPGMTEFELTEKSVLGLMPAEGIKRVLNSKIKLPVKKENEPRAEIYLLVNNTEEYILRAKEAGAKILDELHERDWGHKAIYFEDPDGYIIALAELIK